MRPLTLLTVLIFAVGTFVAFAQSVQCPANPSIVYIEKGVNDTPAAVVSAAGIPNTEVLLAPDVDIDFSPIGCAAGAGPSCAPGTEGPLIKVARCVTLASYQPQHIIEDSARSGAPGTARSVVKAPAAAGAIAIGGTGGEVSPVPGLGRTPNSPGPVLRFGSNKNRSSKATFIGISCSKDNTAPTSSEGVRILGFRVFGPNFNDHQTSEVGINIEGCYDEEIANMEVAGWGAEAIRVDDDVHFSAIPTSAPENILVRIHDNYIHHNQHSTSGLFGGHALGYGVAVSGGAFAEIDQNVFDYNRHSITASGKAGGYYAMRNLLLKGGGFHNQVFYRDIHIMDVHGTGDCGTLGWEAVGAAGGAAIGAGIGFIVGGPVGAAIGGVVGGVLGFFGVDVGMSNDSTLFNCGNAGFKFAMEENTFQYNKTTDLKIRGKPKNQALISANIFARSSKDDAIKLETSDNVTITDSNRYNDDTFGHYGVCDIDGDGIDDLVLMTGMTWWFSSAGVYPWSYLKMDSAVLKDVRLGDFDGDGRCDVLMDAGGGNWMISSGATADWKPYGNYLAPLNLVAFGRFDPKSPDFSRGIRRPTHAFWRGDNGSWFVTPLSQPGGWTLVQNSSFPFSALRFGDFTGDGVTDVLANEAGRWAISNAARGSWQKLNPTLNDPVQNSNIFIANMDATDNVDDVLRFDVSTNTAQYPLVTYTGTWKRSANGTTPWATWKTYNFVFGDFYPQDFVQVGPAFVGQFRGSPGLAALTIDQNRIGHFYSPGQGKNFEEWQSMFAY